VHSVAMGAGARNRRDSGLPHALPERTYQTSAQLVRLSHLRKLCECEQVAAVCYRWRGDGIEFLLVRTRGGGRWTFPKGSAEPGLTHAQAAALEAFEEAGVHGRIEEATFATYVRREHGTGRSDAKSGEKKFAVSAHLCEVSRLSAPKESGRNRTWFSAAEARQRLREGRRSEDGAVFARVIHKAVARLQWLRGGTGIVDDRPQDRPQQNGLQRDTLQTDGLQKVRFEAFAGAAGGEALFTQNIRRRLNGMRQFAVPVVDNHSPEVLRGEVLQFDPMREKKAKALGTGLKKG
jgi:8-oxo-dGTP pyrophosphatase MutT (NUDIX family)